MSSQTYPIAGGTGHREPHPRPDVEAWLRPTLLKTLRYLRDVHGTTTVISGLALRWDTWLADAALELDLELWGYSPGRWQADTWSPDQKAHWRDLCAAATRMEYADPGDRYKPAAFHIRNDWIFRDCDLGVTDWRYGTYKGGTYHAMDRAVARRKPVLWLGEGDDPPNCRIRLPNLDEWDRLLESPKRARRWRKPAVEQGALPI